MGTSNGDFKGARLNRALMGTLRWRGSIGL